MAAKEDHIVGPVPLPDVAETGHPDIIYLMEGWFSDGTNSWPKGAAQKGWGQPASAPPQLPFLLSFNQAIYPVEKFRIT